MNKKVVPALCLLLFAAALSSPSFGATLVGWYRFDDSSQLAKDSSGLNNHGTVIDNGAAPIYSTTGYTGGAADFRNGGKINIPFNTGPSLWPDLTWGAWVKPRTTSGIRQLFNNDDGGFDRALGIDNRSAGNFSAFTGAGTYNTGILPSTNSWTFFAGVYENNFYGSGQGRLTLYVGNQILSDIRTTYGTTAWTYTSIGGSPTFGEFWDGLIDDAFLIGGAATAAEMSQIMNSPSSINTIAQGMVPEPSSGMLVVAGLAALAMMRRRRDYV